MGNHTISMGGLRNINIEASGFIYFRNEKRGKLILQPYANLVYCNRHIGKLIDLPNWTVDILNGTAETPKLHCNRACGA